MTVGSMVYIIGNWKMNGICASLEEVDKIAAGLDKASDSQESILRKKCVLCLPATLLALAKEKVPAKAKDVFFLGGQNCHEEEHGPYTGDISAKMLKDVGADYVILGHSERRLAYQESSAMIAKRVEVAWKNGVTPIICVGETLKHRESGQTFSFIQEQIMHSVPFSFYKKALDQGTLYGFLIAYEPIWAIGTGRALSFKDIEEIHNKVRAYLLEILGDVGTTVPLLYGGSVNKENARDILHVQNVNGVLVGGASLRSEDFLPIYNS